MRKMLLKICVAVSIPFVLVSTVSAVYEYEYTEEPEYPTPTVYYVEFDEGEHGRISSGWWYQEVYEGQWPEVPEIEPLDGWRFVGWSPEVSEIWGDMTFVAQYEVVSSGDEENPEDEPDEGGGTNDVVAAYCEVTAVAVKPRWPWNGIVDIDYTLQVEPTNGMAVVTVSGCDTVLKRTLAPRTLSGEGSDGDPVSAGTHRLTWDIGMDYPQFHSEAFTVDVMATPVTNLVQEAGLYMVIDLSGGTNAVSYPVSYMNEVPVGGWAAEHKTTKLVMRRIEAGSFVMSDKYNVTLTKPFYMGVFEVTQKQYELVTGDNPSKYKGDARPVEMVSWNTIRGDSDIYNWPSNRTVDAASFMGIIQQKTGLGLDLPTEAQWEYACRAGTTSAYNNGGSTTNDLNVLGRYSGNRNDGKGGYSEHTTVGSYLPNVWGLYDMHGNVFEWCLDWIGSLLNGTDPVGSVSGSIRVLRGGSCYYDASTCTSSYRYGSTPSDDSSYDGFRLACSAEQ